MLGRVVIITLTAVALSLSACGGDDSSTPSATPTTTRTSTADNGGIVQTVEPTQTISYATAATDDERTVALLESGYTVEGGAISVGVVLHNRNRSEAVVVPYSIELVRSDRSTEQLASQKVVLLPDERVGDGFFAGGYPIDHTTVASVKISVQLPLAIWLPFAATDRLTLSSAIEFSSTSAGDYSIVGEIGNPFDEGTGPLRLCVLGRDNDGKIVNGRTLHPGDIEGHSTATFNLFYGGDGPEYGGSVIDAEVTRWETYVSFANEFAPWMTAQ